MPEIPTFVYFVYVFCFLLGYFVCHYRNYMTKQENYTARRRVENLVETRAESESESQPACNSMHALQFNQLDSNQYFHENMILSQNPNSGVQGIIANSADIRMQQLID